MLRLSLIIPTYNRSVELQRLLRNLDLQIRAPEEVIIVDASSSADTEKMVMGALERHAYPIRYFRHEKGLTKQRNFGVFQAKYEIIGFTDDDSLFEPDYFDRVLKMFVRDTTEEIGGASGFIIDVDPSSIPLIDERVRSIATKEDFSRYMKEYKVTPRGIGRSQLRERIEKMLRLQREREGTYCSASGRFYHLRTLFMGQREVDFLRGIAFYRKGVFDSVKYSEFFQGYGYAEDVHFSLQVGRRHKLVVDGEAVCYHLHASSGRPDFFKIGHMSAENLFYIFNTYEKHSFMNHLGFWYFVCADAILDFIPAVVGIGFSTRTKLFLGRVYGGISGIVRNLRGIY